MDEAVKVSFLVNMVEMMIDYGTLSEDEIMSNWVEKSEVKQKAILREIEKRHSSLPEDLLNGEDDKLLGEHSIGVLDSLWDIPVLLEIIEYLQYEVGREPA